MMKYNGRATAAFATAAGYAAYRVAARVRRGFDLNGAAVLITGGGRGLGLELARTYAAEGASLALVARDPDELERARHELAGRGATVVTKALDLRARGAGAEAVRWAHGHYRRLDVLVNNAGLIQVAPAEHVADEDFEDALALHFWAALDAMRAAFEVMRAQPARGRIVNVSSIGGLVAVPHLIPYSASKFALTGLSDGLRAAYRRDGVFVTTVCPGLMRTGSPANATFRGQAAKEFAWFALSDANPLFSMNAARAARQIVAASKAGRARLTITAQARLLDAFTTLAPELAADALALAERLLPAPTGPAGDTLRMGYEVAPDAPAPDVLLHLSDEAAARNNEAPAMRP